MGGVFVNVNRGKRSVVLDLRTGAGQDGLRALIERSDVFVHSMRAKAITALGFSYPEVAAVNPSIVYTNCYGYGRRGPDADLTAYDDIIQEVEVAMVFEHDIGLLPMLTSSTSQTARCGRAAPLRSRGVPAGGDAEPPALPDPGWPPVRAGVPR